MCDAAVAEQLRKLAAEIRQQAEKAGRAMQKQASAGTVKLDPRHVLNFMLFYGR